jgi:hypothetical protein
MERVISPGGFCGISVNKVSQSQGTLRKVGKLDGQQYPIIKFRAGEGKGTRRQDRLDRPMSWSSGITTSPPSPLDFPPKNH